MDKIPINFIITCYNREAYWPYLKEVLSSYKHIDPKICLAYNGDRDDFECQVRIKNSGHQTGELELVQAGYEFHKKENPDVKFFIKLGVDSWLLNEDVILNLRFLISQKFKVPYAGNFWNTKEQLSTDIFFADLNHGNIFEEFKCHTQDEVESLKSGKFVVENLMFRAVAKLGGNFYLIREREPVHPYNRDECLKLCWVMHHDLEKNVSFFNYVKTEYPKRQINHSFEILKAKKSDINEHLAKIQEVSVGAKIVTEIGSRGGVQSWAFLKNGPDKLVCIDPSMHSNLLQVQGAAKEIGCKFEFKTSELCYANIEQTDVLFIDTVHERDIMRKILEKNSKKVNEVIIIHEQSSILPELDGWQLTYSSKNNNGLQILTKV